MSATDSSEKTSWPFLGLVLLVFFFLLGTRSLNEPDEGRYGDIARSMVETGDWLVPHIWYVPHLDKPPFTYWAVAASLKFFGFNEWAVRLPLALAGLSGALAAYLFTRSLSSPRTARWAVSVLASSTLYFAMARMLTTDIFLTQFIAWALYGFWKSWRTLDGLGDSDEEVRARSGKRFFVWHVFGWLALAGGFLTKGPIALLIPAVAFLALVVYRRREKLKLNLLVLGAFAGASAFCTVALPWFLMVFEQVPQAYEFMVKGQVVGHAMGGEALNRAKPLLYFVPILAFGFLPWTPLLGWLWRREHWRSLDEKQKEGWLLVSVWALFTFAFFCVNSAKLPAYILPMFPALAILTALRWPQAGDAQVKLPVSVWRMVLLLPLLAMAAVPMVYRFAFQVTDLWWQWPQFSAGLAGMVVLGLVARRWTSQRCARWALGLAVVNLFLLVGLVPDVETRLRSNQTLKPLGLALKEHYRPGTAIVCWTRLPQGLPFHAYPAINATNRAYLGGMPLHRVPFEYPGNAGRFGPLLLPDEQALVALLKKKPALIVGFQGTHALSQSWTNCPPLKLILRSGQWELLANH